MKHDEFDKKMRAFEKSNDETIRPDMYVVCRIDGRNFSTLTRKIKLKPYDESMANNMQSTVKHLMDCGFPVAFGYTQSDEISLLMDHTKIPSFAGKVRKYNSILAAEASSQMTLMMGLPIVFDCRTIQLPTGDHVFDYFAWRRSDSERNCLNMWTYYFLRKDGKNPTEAQRIMEGKRQTWKHDLLFNRGVNFDTIPDWQKRGYGFRWIPVYKQAFNPKKNKPIVVLRRGIQEIVLPRTHGGLKVILSELV